MRIARQPAELVALPVTVIMMAVTVVIMRMTTSVFLMYAVQRLKRFGYFSHRCAQPDKQVAHVVVAANQNALLFDLRGDMPAAEMPREMAERGAVPCAYLVKRFLGGDDFGIAAVIEDQPVTMFKDHCFGKIDQDLVAMNEFHRPAPHAPLVMRQNREIERDRQVRCIMGAHNLAGARELGEIGVDGEFHGAWRE